MGGCDWGGVHDHAPGAPRTLWWRGFKMRHSGRIGNRRRLAGADHPLSQEFLSHDSFKLRAYLLQRNAPRALFGDSHQMHAGSGQKRRRDRFRCQRESDPRKLIVEGTVAGNEADVPAAVATGAGRIFFGRGREAELSSEDSGPDRQSLLLQCRLAVNAPSGHWSQNDVADAPAGAVEFPVVLGKHLLPDFGRELRGEHFFQSDIQLELLAQCRRIAGEGRLKGLQGFWSGRQLRPHHNDAGFHIGVIHNDLAALDLRPDEPLTDELFQSKRLKRWGVGCFRGAALQFEQPMHCGVEFGSRNFLVTHPGHDLSNGWWFRLGASQRM